MSYLGRLIAALALALAGATASAAPPSADWRAEGPKALVITYRVEPGARPALRQSLRASLLPRLEGLRARGELTRYRVLANRFVDNACWDAMAMLEFRDSAALARWRRVEDATPAGLPPEALRLVSTVETAPGTLMREGAAARRPGEPAPVYLVVPYDYLVSTDEYLHYVDGYLLPQLEGWTREQALGGYQLFLARYPAGRTWSALLMLAYRGDAGLDARDRVVQQVRARLAATDPAWKAFADTKTNMRKELQPVVADELTP